MTRDYEGYKPQIYDQIAITSLGKDFTVSPAKTVSTTVLVNTAGAYNFLYPNNVASKNTISASTTSSNNYIGIYALNALDFVVDRLVITNSSTSAAKVNLYAAYPFGSTTAASTTTLAQIEIPANDTVFLSKHEYDIILHTGVVSSQSLVGGTINMVLGYGLAANATQTGVQINGWGYYIRGD